MTDYVRGKDKKEERKKIIQIGEINWALHDLHKTDKLKWASVEHIS